MADRVDLEVLRRLGVVSAQVNAGHRLEDTLQAVADGVVEALRFGCAAVNFRLANGDFQVMAVSGPPEARASLVSKTIPGVTMQRLLTDAERWGDLRYICDPQVLAGDPAVWTPDIATPRAPDAWGPEDILLVPLGAPDGELVGVLSVDLPPDQKRPDRQLCELLEMFAVSAGVAITNARLAEELRREHERLRASETAFRFSFTASASAMGTLGLEPERLGRFLHVNHALAGVLGYHAAELVERRWDDVVAPQQRAIAEAVLAEFATGRRRTSRLERQMVRKDGTVFWADLAGSVIEPGDQAPFLLIHVEDITDRKAAEESLTRQANLDALTGLPNRRLVYKYLDGLVGEVGVGGRRGAVLYCDLDGFKEINDRYGHATGDIVLQEAVARLKAQVRVGDVIGRLGGDEFVIVAVDIDDVVLESLVARIRAAFAKPLTTVPEVIRISVGRASVSGAEDSAAILDNADQAMYADKHRAPAS